MNCVLRSRCSASSSLSISENVALAPPPARRCSSASRAALPPQPPRAQHTAARLRCKATRYRCAVKGSLWGACLKVSIGAGPPAPCRGSPGPGGDAGTKLVIFASVSAEGPRARRQPCWGRRGGRRRRDSPSLLSEQVRVRKHLTSARAVQGTRAWAAGGQGTAGVAQLSGALRHHRPRRRQQNIPALPARRPAPASARAPRAEAPPPRQARPGRPASTRPPCVLWHPGALGVASLTRISCQRISDKKSL